MELFRQITERKENSKQFLLEYLTVKQLGEAAAFDEDEDMATDPGTELSKPNPFDPNLAAGQIRLLSNTDRITYVALLKRWEQDSFVVMPFSNFNYPATDEEFRVSFDGGLFLRVMQAWNTRTVADDMLKQSWLVGTMPQKDIDDAWHMWEHTLGGKVPESGLWQRTGVPIYKEGDPRLEYKGHELANMSKWVQ